MLTANQLRVLEILGRWGGMGTIEVEIQYGQFDYGDDEAGEAKGWRITRFVVRSVVRSLARKGLAVDGPDGYDITDAGRAAVSPRSRP